MNKSITFFLFLSLVSCFKHDTNDLNQSVSPLGKQFAESKVWWMKWQGDALRSVNSEQRVLVFISQLSHHQNGTFFELFNQEQISQRINKDFVSFFIDADETPSIAEYFYQLVPSLHQGKTVALILDEKMQLISFDTEPVEFNQRLQSKIPPTVLVKTTKLKHDEDQKQLVSFYHEIKNEFQNEIGHFPELNLAGHYQVLSLLLKIYNRHENSSDAKEILGIINKTLLTLYASEHYDHIQGGFFNHIQDPKALSTPVMEKDLQTNVAMANLYLEAFQLTGQELYKEVTLELLNFITQNLRQPRGAFYTSVFAPTAQSHFGLTALDLEQKLNRGEYKKMLEVYHLNHFLSVRDKGAIYLTFREDIQSIRQKINRYLVKQKTPRIDERVILAYNAQTMKLFTKAFQVFKDKKYISWAYDILQAMKKELFTKKGTFRYVTKIGEQELQAQDYVYLTDAYLSLYETDLDDRWLQEAMAWQEQMNQNFFDKETNTYLQQTTLPKTKLSLVSFEDTLWKQTWIQNLYNLMKISALTNEASQKQKVEQALKQVKSGVHGPKLINLTSYLSFLDFKLEYPKHVFVKVSNKEKTFLDYVHQTIIPSLIIGRFEAASKNREIAKPTEVKPQMAIVCQLNICSEPLTSLKDLRKILQEKMKLELE